jgi:hypothetical protein
MRDVVCNRVIIWICAIAVCVATPADLRADPPADFPTLPLPPSVEGLVAFPKTPLCWPSRARPASPQGS